MKQAVMYVRVSSKEQQQGGFSIPAQLKLLEAYSQEHGFEVVQVFQDVETAKRAGRQSFEAMLAFLRKSAGCKTILVEKTDRLYRNIRDWVTLDDLQADIHFVKENFILNDEAKSSEKFVHGIKVLMAKNYVDNLGEEASKGMLEKARQGLYPSYPPLGYLNERESRSIVPDPDRASLILKLFKAYATGRESYEALVLLAFQMGLRTRKGNKLSKSVIARTLDNLTYTGSFVWKGTTYPGKYEPIISRALFDQVQERINVVTHSNPKRHDHAFRGLVRCGTCGCMVTAQTAKQKYTYYHCTHGRGDCSEKAVREETLAEMLGEPLKGLELSQERIEWIMAQVQADDAEGHSQRTEERRRLERDKTDLEAKLDLIYEDKLTGTITKEFWKKKHEEYTSRLSWIQGEIQKLEQESGSDLASVERILELSQKAYSLYLARKPHEQRELLDILLLNTTLKDKTAKVELKETFGIIADGVKEDRDKIEAGEPILANNENWLPG